MHAHSGKTCIQLVWSFTNTLFVPSHNVMLHCHLFEAEGQVKEFLLCNNLTGQHRCTSDFGGCLSAAHKTKWEGDLIAEQLILLWRCCLIKFKWVSWQNLWMYSLGPTVTNYSRFSSNTTPVWIGFQSLYFWALYKVNAKMKLSMGLRLD